MTTHPSPARWSGISISDGSAVRMIWVAMVLAVGFAPVAGAQGELIVGAPRSGVRKRVGAIERLMEMRTDESARKFVEENLAPALRTSQTTDLWLTNIKAMRQLFRNFSTVNFAPSGERGLAVLFGGCPGEGTPILLEIDSNPPHWITGFRLGEKTTLPARTKTAPQIDLTWENLADKLKCPTSPTTKKESPSRI